MKFSRGIEGIYHSLLLAEGAAQGSLRLAPSHVDSLIILFLLLGSNQQLLQASFAEDVEAREHSGVLVLLPARRAHV